LKPVTVVSRDELPGAYDAVVLAVAVLPLGRVTLWVSL
jgi:hypothetical protein